MKIAVISPGFMPVPAVVGGAVETLVTNLIEENEKKSHLEIIVYTIYNKKIRSNYLHTKIIQYRKNIFHKVYYRIRNYITGKPHVFYCDKVVSKLKKNLEQFDYIIVENNIDLLLQIIRSIEYEVLGKLVFHFHNDMNTLEYTENKFKIIWQCKIPVIVVSQYVKKHILCLFPQMNVYVLKNAINFNQFDIKLAKREKIRRLYNIQQDTTVIMFSGRLVEYKGILELIYAYQEVLKMGHDNTRLLLIGSYNNMNGTDDEFTVCIKQLANKCGEKIIFTGFVEHMKIQDYYAAADIVVVPSKGAEAAGLVPLEAQAMKKPVIATNVGGIPEYEIEGSCCLIENNNDLVQSIVKELHRLLIDQKLVMNIVERGWKNVQCYKSENYLEHFLDILKKIENKERD